MMKVSNIFLFCTKRFIYVHIYQYILIKFKILLKFSSSFSSFNGGIRSLFFSNSKAVVLRIFWNILTLLKHAGYIFCFFCLVFRRICSLCSFLVQSSFADQAVRKDRSRVSFCDICWGGSAGIPPSGQLLKIFPQSTVTTQIFGIFCIKSPRAILYERIYHDDVDKLTYVLINRRFF